MLSLTHGTNRLQPTSRTPSCDQPRRASAPCHGTRPARLPISRPARSASCCAPPATATNQIKMARLEHTLAQALKEGSTASRFGPAQRRDIRTRGETQVDEPCGGMSEQCASWAVGRQDSMDKGQLVWRTVRDGRVGIGVAIAVTVRHHVARHPACATRQCEV